MAAARSALTWSRPSCLSDRSCRTASSLTRLTVISCRVCSSLFAAVVSVAAGGASTEGSSSCAHRGETAMKLAAKTLSNRKALLGVLMAGVFPSRLQPTELLVVMAKAVCRDFDCLVFGIGLHQDWPRETRKQPTPLAGWRPHAALFCTQRIRAQTAFRVSSNPIPRVSSSSRTGT